MTPEELVQAVKDRRSITGAGFCRLPAAVIVNMQFWQVMLRLPDMKLYVRKYKRITNPRRLLNP